ncbi:ROK family protein [Streptomyces sp. NPDC004284]|uniref:ROK family protein n=1 Tax=Streptomyces sp. NPDC004284 TaxID=3364695 RepID=UPI0036983EC9
MTAVPVLEIGGTHVTAALVDLARPRPRAAGTVRLPLDAHAGAAALLDTVATAGRRVGAPAGSVWGVAVPGPFDYPAGVGRFRDVGKFESLNGVDVGAELTARLPARPRALAFLNDADAFALGEYHAGAAAGRRRALGITLGTGVGTSFLDAGAPVTEGPLVPPDGRAHLLSIDGRPLEDVVSRRAIRARYARLAGPRAGNPDVREIAGLARTGEAAAAATLRHCFEALGRALAPWCARFRPDVLVAGGSLTASWDLIAPPLRAGLAATGESLPAGMELRPAAQPHDAPLVGAAHWAERSAAGRPGVRL